ncbi:MAG TPA: hypothetical protein VF646_16610 [Cytophagales bacterium]|jgi:hypothetical protein
MQKLLLFPALAVVLLPACQPTGKPAQEKVAAAPVPPARPDSLPAAPDADAATEEGLLDDFPSFAHEARRLPAGETQKLLAAHDLASLWAMTERESAAVYNGFYGPDHYRIEMHFASVTRDSLHPNQLHVTGKSRYKKNITPFSGTVTIDSLSTLHLVKRAGDPEVELGNERRYLAVGHFALREDSLAAGSGQFAGKVTFDFTLDQEGDLSFDYFFNTPTRHGGFLFEGEWRSYQTGNPKPVLWADNFFAVAEGVLKNFNVGERDVEINPAYRHLGWDTYWSDEEWWNEAGPVLQ